MEAATPRDPSRSPITADAGERRVLEDVRRLRASGEPAEWKFHGPDGTTLEIPASLQLVLDQAVESLAAGESVAVVAMGQQLTTQEAADLLGVSRQYLVRLLDSGRIPSVRTGSHRRVRLDDVLHFKALRDRERMAALAEIAQIHQESGGYDEP
jgi:excisionase family DNA binding protein